MSPYERVRCSYDELATVLGRALIVPITTAGVEVVGGAPGRAVERLRPGTLLRYGPAPEPMLKHFEAMAAGCCVVTDQLPDWSEMGIQEDKHVVLFSTPDEAVDKVAGLLCNPDAARRIGAAAAQIVLTHHTWSHRAREIDVIVESTVAT